jgi:hypothetical protein
MSLTLPRGQLLPSKPQLPHLVCSIGVVSALVFIEFTSFWFGVGLLREDLAQQQTSSNEFWLQR